MGNEFAFGFYLLGVGSAMMGAFYTPRCLPMSSWWLRCCALCSFVKTSRHPDVFQTFQASPSSPAGSFAVGFEDPWACCLAARLAACTYTH
jgi:hypothetical protein